jgi:hypothetical protein
MMFTMKGWPPVVAFLHAFLVLYSEQNSGFWPTILGIVIGQNASFVLSSRQAGQHITFTVAKKAEGGMSHKKAFLSIPVFLSQALSKVNCCTLRSARSG